MAMVSSTGTRYHHQNRIYHVMAMTNSSGQLAERYGYTPYGKRRVVSPADATLAASAVGNQVGFTGRYHDGETGLMYFRARYMDAELGRFVGRDPIGYVDGASLYGSYFVPGGFDPAGTQWYNNKWFRRGLEATGGYLLDKLFDSPCVIGAKRPGIWKGTRPCTYTCNKPSNNQCVKDPEVLSFPGEYPVYETETCLPHNVWGVVSAELSLGTCRPIDQSDTVACVAITF